MRQLLALTIITTALCLTSGVRKDLGVALTPALEIPRISFVENEASKAPPVDLNGFENLSDRIREMIEEKQEELTLTQEDDSEVAYQDMKPEKIKKAIKEKVLREVRERLGKAVSESAIPCNERYTDDTAVMEACRLCKSDVAFHLNAENWYKIGIAHSQRAIFGDLLSDLSYVIPNANFTVAFGAEDYSRICLSSNRIEGDIVIKKLIKDMNMSNHHRVPETHYFKPSESVTPYLISAVYIVGLKPNKGNYDHLNVYFHLNQTVPLVNDGSLNFEIGHYSSVDDKVKLLGKVVLAKILKLRMTMEYTEEDIKNSVLAATCNLRLKPLRLGMLIQFFFGDNARISKLIDTTQTERVLGYVDNYFISEVAMQIELENYSISKLLFNFLKFPEFALSPEILVKNPVGFFALQIAKEGHASVLRIKGETTNHDKTLDMYVNYIQTHKNLSVNLSTQQQEVEFKHIEDLILSNSNSSQGKRLFPNEKRFNLFDINNYKISNLSIEVVTPTKPAYYITGEVVKKDLEEIGSFACLSSYMGGFRSTLLKLDIPNTSIAQFLENMMAKDSFKGVNELNHVFDSNGLVVEMASHDTDLSYFPSLEDFNPSNHGQWTKGIALSYVFNLNEVCVDSSFCEFMHDNYAHKTHFELNGQIRNDSAILLQKVKAPTETSSKITFDDLHLELQIPFTSSAGPQLSILHKSVINIAPDTDIKFNGSISFTQDGARLKSQAQQPWADVLGINSLNIDNLELSADIDSETNRISNTKAYGLGIYGQSCFTQDGNGEYLFDSQRCLYGETMLQLDLNNPNASLISGALANLTSYQFLSALGGFDNAYIAHNISKVFRMIKFTEVANYWIAFEDNEQPNEAELTLQKGLTVVAAAEFAGIQGSLHLHINYDKDLITGQFIFPTTKLCHDTITLRPKHDAKNNAFNLTISDDVETKNQVALSADVSVLGLRLIGDLSIAEERVFFQGVGLTLSGLMIISEGSAPFVNSLVDTDFLVSLHVNKSGFPTIEKKFLEVTKVWQDTLVTMHNQILEALNEIKGEVEEKQTKLCPESACPLHPICSSAPTLTCREYKMKKVCKSEEEYCLEASTKCARTEQRCIFEEEVCAKRQDENDENECVETTVNCREFVNACLEYKYECIGDSVKMCLEYQEVEDKNDCVKHVLVCDEHWTDDQNCHDVCLQRQQEFDNATAKLNASNSKVETAVEDFNRAFEFIKEIDPEVAVFEIDAWHYDQLLEEKVEGIDAKWVVKYSVKPSKAEEATFNSVELTNIVFKSIDELVPKLFSKVIANWAVEYSFSSELATDMVAFVQEIQNFIQDNRP